MDSIDVSLLTCEPFGEVYALFGHTAIRVQDRSLGTDLVVNYGVFDRTEPNFIMHFVLGQTDYYMGVSTFGDFAAEYRALGPRVYQQRLLLTADEKQALLAAVAENARPENVRYRYNYFFNNCSTRARDVLLGAVAGDVHGTAADSAMTFRDLVHAKTCVQPWVAWGVDLLLGVGADRVATASEREFLPEWLMTDFDGLRRAGGSRLVAPRQVLMAGTNAPLTAGSMAGPWTACGVFCLLCLLACVWRKAWATYVLFALAALPGLLLAVMVFSLHPTVSLNFQILILCPLWFVLAFPRLRWRWRWHLVAAMLVAGLALGLWQHYAAGVWLIGAGLLAISATRIKVG